MVRAVVLVSYLRAAVPWLGIALTCGCGGPGAPQPEAPKPSVARELAKPMCRVTKSTTKPLVVEWPSAERADLEARASEGTVVVAYRGCEFKILADCRPGEGAYSYVAVSPMNDRLRIRNRDELYASVPIGAVGLEGRLTSGSELQVDMTMVGKFQASRRAFGRNELRGSCAGATHVVVGMTVGAFEFATQQQREAAGGAKVLGVGAGAATRRSREVLSSAGKRDRCAAATDRDTTPPANCRAVLRLELARVQAHVVPAAAPAAAAPAVVAGPPPPPSDECPEDAAVDDIRCTLDDPAAAVRCPPGTLFDGDRCVESGAPRPPPVTGQATAEAEAESELSEFARRFIVTGRLADAVSLRARLEFADWMLGRTAPKSEDWAPRAQRVARLLHELEASLEADVKACGSDRGCVAKHRGEQKAARARAAALCKGLKDLGSVTCD